MLYQLSYVRVRLNDSSATRQRIVRVGPFPNPDALAGEPRVTGQ
jgi:hypothetical protein